MRQTPNDMPSQMEGRDRSEPSRVMAPAVRAALSSNLGDDLSRARILIVDDEPANTALLEGVLKRGGCEDVVSLNHSTDALQACYQLEPDLLLLDLHMPVMDGYELLAALRTSTDDQAALSLPVLVLTADMDPGAKLRALNLHANDFLTKPFDAIEVLFRVRNLLQVRSAQRILVGHARILADLVCERTRELAQANRGMLTSLANAAEVRDDTTGKHVQRVGASAGLLATELGLSPAEAGLIAESAPLHDLGKIGIPDAILLKAGRLSSAEFDVIKRHPELGASMLNDGDLPLLESARTIALTHHERWDGGGYPRGLGGDQIPLSGRIVSVVDVFDALIHERPYKSAWPMSQALDEIKRSRGTQFAPDVVDAFIRIS